MEPRHFELIATDGACVGEGQVVSDEATGLFEGEVDLGAASANVRSVFDEFEEIVEGQVLSLLDDVQAKVAALSVRVALEGGETQAVEDLQVFPSNGVISFRLARLSSNHEMAANRSAEALSACSQE